MSDMTVWPTDDPSAGSVSSELRWRKMARLWVPSGVRLATDLTPTLVAGPAIQVAPGGLWIDGHFGELAAPATIASTANGLLVARFTPADNRLQLVYRDGASTPTQTDPTYELPIAQVAASVMSDRRMRSGSPPAYPNYTTLKLNRPTPNDGEQAVTLDDGQTWTFRSAAFTLPGSFGTLPANRWETRKGVIVVNAATDANGSGTIPASTFGFDGYCAAIFGHAGWGASAPFLMVGTVRWSSLTVMQIRIYSMSAATGATVAYYASQSNVTLYLDAQGYRV